MTKVVESWKQRARWLKHQTYAVYLAYRDPRTPWYARVFTALIVAYAFSPIDLIPDFIPILGYLDDLILIPLGITIALRLIPGDVMVDCWQRAELALQDERPVNRLAAVIIVGIWILLAVLGIIMLKDLLT